MLLHYYYLFYNIGASSVPTQRVRFICSIALLPLLLSSSMSKWLGFFAIKELIKGKANTHQSFIYHAEKVNSCYVWPVKCVGLYLLQSQLTLSVKV